MTYAGTRSGGTEAALDSVLSFFEAIHHLKDHLGNDQATTATKANCDRLINSSPTLKLCADLANGSKHLALKSTRTGDLATTITRNDATVLLGPGTVAHRFYVESGGAEYDRPSDRQTRRCRMGPVPHRPQGSSSGPSLSRVCMPPQSHSLIAATFTVAR